MDFIQYDRFYFEKNVVPYTNMHVDAGPGEIILKPMLTLMVSSFVNFLA